MITPSNGRIVWYTPYNAEMEGNLGMQVQRDKEGKLIPLAAMVVAVWGDRCVNLVVFDANGRLFPVTSRSLLQDDDVGNEYGGFCEWMPFQRGQAAKTEAAEKALEEARK